MSGEVTTDVAIQAIQWGRAPAQTYPDGSSSHVNRRIVCADGFKVSVQASWMHYCDDSSIESESYYWRKIHDREPVYPFTLVEVGNPSGDLPDVEPWTEDGGGVWGFVSTQAVRELLNTHGGAVAWEVPDA